MLVVELSLPLSSSMYEGQFNHGGGGGSGGSLAAVAVAAVAAVVAVDDNYQQKWPATRVTTVA
jgi:hypothetical protein